MSYPIMPTIPLSLSKGVRKTPFIGGTIYQPTAANMGNAALQVQAFPTWNYDVDLVSVEGDINIANTVLAGFVGTFIACGGRATPFLFTDPNDNAVVQMPFGIGDGTTTIFQISRSIGGVGIDIIQNLNGAPTIYNNFGFTSAWGIDDTGVVTMETPPALGHILTWTGSYYMLSRFAADSLDGLTLVAFNRSGKEYWDCDSIKFSTEFVQPGTAGASVQGIIYENFSGGTF